MASFKGTCMWAAPQIIAMEPYSSKCDLWSIGVILFEMIYGGYPFNGVTA
jgi:serine/threonine protein kinase